MDAKTKDYVLPKESHAGSVFHLTREHLELLVIWSHCHGNQCTFAPTWREIAEEHPTGLLTVLWECEAGHSYHWWTGGVCRLECDRDAAEAQAPAKHKPLEDLAPSARLARKPQRMKLEDGDIMEEIDSLDGCCKPFLTADGKPIRNGASARRLAPSPSQHPWREPAYADDRGKPGTDGAKKPDVLYIKTEKEEAAGYSDQADVKSESRSQSRGPRKYHPGEKPSAAGQGQSPGPEAPDGGRKRSAAAAAGDGSGFAAHSSNGKVHVGEVHHSPYPAPRPPGSSTKSSGPGGAAKPTNHSHSPAGNELHLDSAYGRNSDMSNAELDCDTSIPCTQEGVLEFLHTVLKSEAVDEIYSSVRLANEGDVEVLTENLSGKEALLLDSGIQTNARLYFSTDGWAALSATLEVLGVSDSTSELMVINPYTLNAEIMDEEQIIVAHVPALLPSADDKKRKIKYPVTKGEIRRRIIPPENMSKTVIKSYLRLRRDNRFDIRQLLDLPVTGYDRTLHTSFTRLCEGEAKTLTENFHQLNLGYFPVDECANRIAEQSEASEIFTARKVVEDLDSVLDSFMWQEHPYNLITHGFGPQNIRVVLDLVKLLLRESLRKSAS